MALFSVDRNRDTTLQPIPGQGHPLAYVTQERIEAQNAGMVHWKIGRLGSGLPRTFVCWELCDDSSGATGYDSPG